MGRKRKQVLEEALAKRFGSSTAMDMAAAKKIIEESVGKSWDPNDQAARASDLRAALDLLERGDPERVVNYISASADLQISKAAGLVTYCALLCAIATIQLGDATGAVSPHWTTILVIVCSLFGSAVTLVAVWFRWPSNDSVLETPQAEANWLIDLLIGRARMINGAVVLALVATAALAVNLGLQWLAGSGTRSIPPVETGNPVVEPETAPAVSQP